MRKWTVSAAIVAAALFVSGADAARAQDAPKAEVFAGYSYTAFNDAGVDHLDAHGWHVSATGNVNRWFGFEGDASGHYQDGKSVHYVQGGVKFTARGERISPFAHALTGVNFVDAFSNGTDWVITLGGGVDVKVNEKISIRAIQADYTPTLFLDGLNHNGRLSTGIVFTF
jgi:hypothetical protein